MKASEFLTWDADLSRLGFALQDGPMTEPVRYRLDLPNGHKSIEVRIDAIGVGAVAIAWWSNRETHQHYMPERHWGGFEGDLDNETWESFEGVFFTMMGNPQKERL